MSGTSVQIVNGGQHQPAATTNATLAANATYVSNWIDAEDYASVVVRLESDEASATDGAKVESSNNSSTVLDTFAYTLAADVPLLEIHPSTAKYYRINVTNGGTVQGSFSAHMKLSKEMLDDGNATAIVTGNVTAVVTGNVTAVVSGNVTTYSAGGNITAVVSGNVTAVVSGNVTTYSSGGNITAVVSGDVALVTNATLSPSDNTTNATLSSNVTWVGTYENVLEHRSLVYMIDTDVDGTLFVDHSPDTTTAYTEAFCVSGGVVGSRELLLRSKWVRLRYTNGDDGQTSMALSSMYGKFAPAPVRRETHEEYLTVHKFGYNNDVDGAEDIYSLGTEYPFPTAITATTVVSDSAADDVAGNGALTCRVQGLDENWRLISEDATLTGNVTVTLTKQFFRVFRSWVLTSGVSGTNVGNIQVLHQTTPLAQIDADKGQTLMAVYTTPALDNGESAKLMKWYFSAGKQQSFFADVELKMRTDGGSWRTKEKLNGHSQGSSKVEYEFPSWLSVPQKTDMKISIVAVSAANSAIGGGFDIALGKRA